MIPTGEHRVLQVHPTLSCNLRCLHCYSDSGPEAKTTLPEEIACQAVRDAAACGYGVLAVSGGEPFLYEGIVPLLDAGRDAGLATAVTTNGTLLTKDRLEKLGGRIDLLTISVDGVPESHDRIRNRPGTFARMEEGLSAVRESGIRFGFIFTLTQHNVHELDWVARFAAAQGAQLLQIHPLEMAGRARFTMGSSHPDSIELAFGFAEAFRLRQELSDRIHVHIDVATRPGIHEIIRTNPASVQPTILADAVSPLVIEADGTVVPLTFGFPRTLTLGNLHELRLTSLARRWLASRYDDYREVISRLQADETWADKELPVLSLYEAAISIASDVLP